MTINTIFLGCVAIWLVIGAAVILYEIIKERIDESRREKWSDRGQPVGFDVIVKKKKVRKQRKKTRQPPGARD